MRRRGTRATGPRDGQGQRPSAEHSQAHSKTQSPSTDLRHRRRISAARGGRTSTDPDRTRGGGGVAAFTRRGIISPPRDPSRVPRSFDRAPPHAHNPRARSLYTAKASRKPTARPLTGPAPGSDRRLSGEAHQVGGHCPGGPDDHQAQPAGMDRSPGPCTLRPLPPARDHAITTGQALSLDLRPGMGRRASGPGARQVQRMQGRRPGSRSEMHLQWDRAHLQAYDLHRVRRHGASVGSGAIRSQDRRAISVQLVLDVGGSSRLLAAG
jgi:hypothetical protein